MLSPAKPAHSKLIARTKPDLCQCDSCQQASAHASHLGLCCSQHPTPAARRPHMSHALCSSNCHVFSFETRGRLASKPHVTNLASGFYLLADECAVAGRSTLHSLLPALSAELKYFGEGRAWHLGRIADIQHTPGSTRAFWHLHGHLLSWHTVTSSSGQWREQGEKHRLLSCAERPRGSHNKAKDQVRRARCAMADSTSFSADKMLCPQTVTRSPRLLRPCGSKYVRYLFVYESLLCTELAKLVIDRLCRLAQLDPGIFWAAGAFILR